MNKKMMIIGAGAALLLGSVAIAQTTSSGTDQSTNRSSAYQPAPSATDNSANTSATAPDNSVNAASSSSSTAAANNADANASNTAATAGERG